MIKRCFEKGVFVFIFNVIVMSFSNNKRKDNNLFGCVIKYHTPCSYSMKFLSSHKSNKKIWTTSWLVWKESDFLNGKKRHSNKHTLRNTQECNMRWKIRWFTEVCNSHYVSHFAAFFIVTRAKISIVKSCFLLF